MGHTVSYSPKRGQFKGRTFSDKNEYRRALRQSKHAQQQPYPTYPDDYYYWTMSLSNYEKEQIAWFEKQVSGAADNNDIHPDNVKSDPRFQDLWRAVLDEYGGEFPTWNTQGAYNGALADFLVFTGMRTEGELSDVGSTAGRKK